MKNPTISRLEPVGSTYSIALLSVNLAQVIFKQHQGLSIFSITRIILIVFSRFLLRGCCPWTIFRPRLWLKTS